MTIWIEALKTWNQLNKTKKYTIPKKGTNEHKQILKIMESLKCDCPAKGNKSIKNTKKQEGDGLECECPIKGKKTKEQEGEGLKEIIKNTADLIIGGLRKDFPPVVRNIIKQYGNQIIVEASVCRSPVQKAITTAINILTKNKLNENKNKLSYDNLYHLYILVKLENGVMLRIQKNEVIDIHPIKSLSDADCSTVDININKKITLENLFINTEKVIGKDNLYLYNVINRNCQIFINDILTANKLNNAKLKGFILQDAGALLKDNPRVSKLAGKLTDLAGAFNIIIQGRSIQPNPGVSKLKIIRKVVKAYE